MHRPALVVIDVQNDYFAGGALPLWHARETLAAVRGAILAARAAGFPVVLVQHVSSLASPLFGPETDGVRMHDEIVAVAGDAPVVIKHRADAFHETDLHATLQALSVDALILCGMMTQNCVTHTALSRRADDYREVTVLSGACTTVNELLHRIALDALSTRVTLATVDQALGAAPRLSTRP